MKIIQYLHEGDEANAWMGLCWFDWQRRRYAVAPIGLNVIIVIGVRIGNWLRFDLPKRIMAAHHWSPQTYTPTNLDP